MTPGHYHPHPVFPFLHTLQAAAAEVNQLPPRVNGGMEGEAELAALAALAAGLAHTSGDALLDSLPGEAEPRAGGTDDSAGGEGELPPGIAT